MLCALPNATIVRCYRRRIFQSRGLVFPPVVYDQVYDLSVKCLPVSVLVVLLSLIWHCIAAAQQSQPSPMSHAGSLCLAWQVKDKHCLVIGSGEVALSRVHHLLYAHAKITVVTGQGNVHPGILSLHKEGKIHNLLERNYDPSDLTMYESESVNDALDHETIALFVQDQMIAVVCCCIDDYELSTQIYYQCKVRRLPVNIADKPPLCDFYFGSMFNQDNLQIMISTNGKSPRLLRMVKDTIARNFEGIDVNKAVENLGKVRLGLRAKVIQDDDLSSIEIRMKWIKDLTDMFSISQWCRLDLTDDNVANIILYFPDFPPSNYDQFVNTI